MAGGALIRGLTFPVVQYNPLSAIQPGRAADIHAAYRHAGVICLNGTRERRERPDLPVLSQTIGALVRVVAGYSKHSNKCAGAVSSCRLRRTQSRSACATSSSSRPQLGKGSRCCQRAGLSTPTAARRELLVLSTMATSSSCGGRSINDEEHDTQAVAAAP